MSTAKKTPTASDRETVIARQVDALRERAWKAWTDPEQFAQWWGPHHFACPVCEIAQALAGMKEGWSQSLEKLAASTMTRMSNLGTPC